MRDIKNKLTSSKNTKNTKVNRGKSFGYQDLEFGSGGAGAASFICATGGTVITSGNFKIHKFTSPGTFTVNSVSSDAPNNEANYAVVAGGGGGGGATDNGSGGGGAGGFRTSAHSCGTVTLTAQGYSITIGAGGAGGCGGSRDNGTNGSDSAGLGITSAGGGGGGKFNTGKGLNGGSGGGAGGALPAPNFGCGSVGNTPPVSPPQGNPGSATPDGKGGGGGSSSAASGSTKGNGTAPSLIPGSTLTVGGQGGSSGSAAGGSTGDGGDGRSGSGAGGNGGSGRVRVFSAEQPFSFYGSGVWDMNALYTYVKAGTWS